MKLQTKHVYFLTIRDLPIQENKLKSCLNEKHDHTSQLSNLLRALFNNFIDKKARNQQKERSFLRRGY